MSATASSCRCRRKTSGKAQEQLDAKFEGTELTVAFNPTFLRDGVDALETTEVALETIDPLKPATLRASDGGDFLYLLMPVRTSCDRVFAQRRPGRLAHGLPLLPEVDSREPGSPGSPCRRRQRPGQDEPARSGRLGRSARSFRGVPDAALVRPENQAIVRAEVRTGPRTSCSKPRSAPSAGTGCCATSNRSRGRDLHGLLRVTVFAPDDLALVKGGPSERRTYLDDLLVMWWRATTRPAPTSTGC